MKKYMILLWMGFMCVLFLYFTLATAFAIDSVSQVVNVSTSSPVSSGLSNAYEWFSLHWQTVALVISEVAAFMPTKVNGILQGAIRLIGAWFTKKD